MERRFPRPYLSRWEPKKTLPGLELHWTRNFFYCLFVRYKKCSASHDHEEWPEPGKTFFSYDCEELQQISDAFGKCSELRKLWIVDRGSKATEITAPKGSRLVAFLSNFVSKKFCVSNLRSTRSQNVKNLCSDRCSTLSGLHNKKHEEYRVTHNVQLIEQSDSPVEHFTSQCENATEFESAKWLYANELELGRKQSTFDRRDVWQDSAMI